VALGFSSGGIVALALAARHPEVVAQAVVWEAPAVTVLPDGLAIQEQMMATTEEHLKTHPNDWPGAFLLLMAAVSGGQADLNAPNVVHMMRNAEAFIVDDGRLIVRRAFHPGEVPADLVTIARGEQADPLHVAISEALAALIGCPLEIVRGAEEHEVYVNRPEVLARWLNERV
jgi:pimeloyl-ACP methyl ester carboxylesterase